MRRKLQAALGFLLMIAGVLLVIYGIYATTTFPFRDSNVSNIVSKALLYIMVGVVVFLEGVVIQGFKKIYALVLHLAAIVPYYLAIQQVVQVGNTGATQLQQYFTASQYYFAAGIILNILGLIANNVRRVQAPVSSQKVQAS